MSDTDPHFNLRLPEELKVKLMEAARDNNRSATAEIVARLEETFANEDIVEAKAARDALMVELGAVLQAGLSAAEDLNEVKNALQEAQKVLNAKQAAPLSRKRTSPGNILTWISASAIAAAMSAAIRIALRSRRFKSRRDARAACTSPARRKRSGRVPTA
ncbi:Arc family DNA-binding protein [Azotobacter chroococcum]